MQQTVLISAVRGPDGIGKSNLFKVVVSWYRRCILKDAMTGDVFTDSYTPGGGSFMGKSSGLCETDKWAGIEDFGPDHLSRSFRQNMKSYLEYVDALPHHYYMHLAHAAEIIGYHHPNQRIAIFWKTVYEMIAEDLHFTPETKEEMDNRLNH